MPDIQGFPFKPTWANPRPVLVKQEYIGINNKVVRNLGGGSRFAFDLIWEGYPEDKLQAVADAIVGAYSTDTLVLGLHTDLLRKQDDYVMYVNKKANARATEIEVRTAEIGNFPQGYYMAIADGFYKTNDVIATGTQKIKLTWGLRKTVNAGTRILVNNPNGRFIGIGEPPGVSYSGRSISLDYHGSVTASLMEE